LSFNASNAEILYLGSYVSIFLISFLADEETQFHSGEGNITIPSLILSNIYESLSPLNGG
jgi:hypothetical protein